jgi:capsular exopolysaccharide synthesis family protein
MSRFYDALREASRSHPVTSPDHEWESAAEPADTPPAKSLFGDFGVNEPAVPMDFAPQLEPADPVRGQEVPEPALNFVPADLLNLLPTDGLAPVNGSVGTKAGLVFDERARLLPHAADSVVLEYYRRLRTKILQQHTTKQFRTLLIASSGPQEGKTVTTLNLGLSFAMLPSFKVLVIDGDLRRGTIRKWLGVGADRPGFSDLIEGTVKLDDVILRCDQTSTHFMVRGNSKMSPAELLPSPRLSEQLRHMAEYFDLILVDSAPLNLVTDAQLLATSCDAVLLVARAFHTTRKALEKASRELTGGRIIGSVLNGATRAQVYRRYNGYYK